MKSFEQIMSMLGAMAKHSLFPSADFIGRRRKMSKSKYHKAKPNNFRRNHKPLMGGWAHTLTPRGHNIECPTQDTVRAVEVILRCKCIVKSGRVLVLDYNNEVLVCIGKGNDTVKQMVDKFLKEERTEILANTADTFRIHLLKEHGINYASCSV